MHCPRLDIQPYMCNNTITIQDMYSLVTHTHNDTLDTFRVLVTVGNHLLGFFVLKANFWVYIYGHLGSGAVLLSSLRRMEFLNKDLHRELDRSKRLCFPGRSLDQG